MIGIEEIAPEALPAFWDAHIRYLVEDGIISDDEDIAYFTGAEYRGTIEAHMRRSGSVRRPSVFTKTRAANASSSISGSSPPFAETERVAGVLKRLRNTQRWTARNGTS